MPIRNRAEAAAYMRRWRKNNPTERHKVNQRLREWRQRIKAMIRKAKDKPCQDCHVAYPWYVMDFDHLPGNIKLAVPSRLVKTGWSVRKIRAELAKCDVVCANCHRERTHKRYIQARSSDLAEHRAYTSDVVGSKPSAPTNLSLFDDDAVP